MLRIDQRRDLLAAICIYGCCPGAVLFIVGPDARSTSPPALPAGLKTTAGNRIGKSQASRSQRHLRCIRRAVI